MQLLGLRPLCVGCWWCAFLIDHGVLGSLLTHISSLVLIMWRLTVADAAVGAGLVC